MLKQITGFQIGSAKITGIATTIGNPGSDANVPTEQAVREGLAAVGGSPRNYNSLTYVYKDAATVTVAANGQATTADGSVTHTLTAATDVSLTADLDTGSEAANTLYYLWIGTVTGTVTLKFSASATTPTGLTNPVRLPGAVRNGNDSNIMPFAFEGSHYIYDLAINCDGSDVTEVYDATLSTTFTDIDCSAFVPTSIRYVLIAIVAAAATPVHRVRINGSAHEGLLVTATPYYAPTDNSSIFEAKNGGAYTTRISVVGYEL